MYTQNQQAYICYHLLVPIISWYLVKLISKAIGERDRSDQIR